MSGFEPGEGWREVSEDVFHEGGAVDYAIRRWSDTGRLPTDHVSYWVREVPGPPLPTEPWTVIRGTMPSGADLTCILHENGQWWDASGIAQRDVHRYVDGFELLSEPRAVTVKAVIDRVLHLPSWGDGIPISNIEALAREIGGES